jgi:hypothetical protein
MDDRISNDPISDDLIDELLPPSELRTGPTGPRTPAGKAKSSENSFKHGCRSAKTVLRHENPAAFEATVQGWLTHYQPDTQPAITLVENLARALGSQTQRKTSRRSRMGAPRQRLSLDRRAPQALRHHQSLQNHCRAFLFPLFQRSRSALPPHPPRRARPSTRLRQTRRDRIQAPRQSRRNCTQADPGRANRRGRSRGWRMHHHLLSLERRTDRNRRPAPRASAIHCPIDDVS